jgi:subtilisin family serine protease
VVAVLDTGGDVLPTPHVDIAPNLDFARSRSFVTPTGAPLPAGDPNPAAWDDKHGHGSWCLSGVGAPINTLGVSGVAPNVTLVVLKVLGDTGSGTFLGLANALVYAGLNHFDVASMSLGGYLNKSGTPITPTTSSRTARSSSRARTGSSPWRRRRTTTST